jgi:hypothetical protein
MKTGRMVAAAAAFLLTTVTLAAYGQKQVRETLEPAVRPASAPSTIGGMIERMHKVKASVVALDWTTSSFIIPVAGNTPGSGGTYFRSDVVFRNDRSTSQRIAVGWLAQGQNNCSQPVQYFTLTANSITAIDDFVNHQINKSGLGGLLVLAVTATGDADDDGEIDGYSRIWTPQPGSSGSVSQNFTAIDVNDSLGSLPATLMGLKQNSQFRTNVGIVNLDTSAGHTWTFTSDFTGAVTSLFVQPCSVGQIGAVAGSGSALGNASFTVKSDGFGFYWSGFGSSSDNVTGDGWVSRAIQ